MRTADVFVHNQYAGQLLEIEPQRNYRFEYKAGYDGAPVSLTMPVEVQVFSFDRFPPFFEGVLPEGPLLEGLLRGLKLDRHDFMGQLLATGGDLVGAVTVAAPTNAL